MNLEIDVWDAFTSGDKGGNRASVIFGMDLRRQDEMQHLAKDLGTPASVFVGEPVWENSVCSIKLRFFTPEIEETICLPIHFFLLVNAISRVVRDMQWGNLQGWRFAVRWTHIEVVSLNFGSVV